MTNGYANRLRRIMDALKLKQAGLAERLNVSQGTVSRWLKGNKVDADNREVIERLETEVFGPSHDKSQVATVPLIGATAINSDTITFADDQDAGEFVDAPADVTEATVAVRVRGNLFGRLLVGWLVYYDDVKTAPDIDLVGELCVCGLADGRVAVKKLAKWVGDNNFHLESNVEPTEFEVRVEWASQVKEVRK